MKSEWIREWRRRGRKRELEKKRDWMTSSPVDSVSLLLFSYSFSTSKFSFYYDYSSVSLNYCYQCSLSHTDRTRFELMDRYRSTNPIGKRINPFANLFFCVFVVYFSPFSSWETGGWAILEQLEYLPVCQTTFSLLTCCLFWTADAFKYGRNRPEEMHSTTYQGFLFCFFFVCLFVYFFWWMDYFDH